MVNSVFPGCLKLTSEQKKKTNMQQGCSQNIPNVNEGFLSRFRGYWKKFSSFLLHFFQGAEISYGIAVENLISFPSDLF